MCRLAPLPGGAQMQGFKGKVAVVTGGANGIGRSLGKRFAEEGMKVVLADIEEEALAKTVDEFTRQGFEVAGVRTDVADPAAIEALANQTVERFGGVHILCNNAGVAGDLDFLSKRGERIWEHSMKDWKWTFDINFWGVVHGIRTFTPIMLSQGEEGHIVNTASMAGLLSGPTADIYGATKHAVVRITEALYHQLKLDHSPVSASVLCPGIIKTRIYSSGRNRPGALFEGDHPSGTDLRQQAAEADTYWAKDGLSPDEVAGQVLQSIRDDQLYILTRDVPLERISERTENIVNGRNPRVTQPRPIRP